MQQIYLFISGPLLWLSFGIFFVGLAYRVVNYVRGLDWQLDRVAYQAHPALGIKGALRSIIHWLVPYYSVGWRAKPLYTFVFFLFHIGLVGDAAVPGGPRGHLQGALGGELADHVHGDGRYPDHRGDGHRGDDCHPAPRPPRGPDRHYLYDYFLIVVSVTPFVTGFLAVHQAAEYDLWLIAHVLSGELLLVLIPATKLWHVVGFFLSRGQIGADFGIKRGYKGKGFAW